MPEIMLNRVVLPAPLGPMTDTISPGSTLKATSCTARRPPKVMPRPWISSRLIFSFLVSCA
ncbi:Uncharacterised protein [Bordetella pertussis]|nr:Uncharacterised protein [Bordetella pertussis]CFU00252.1 Uncharacterised protein [Bordetella pertussis]